jgi:hypothetical protein
MAFDKPTRNALSKMVAECRRLLTDDVREQLQATFGIQPDGTALDIEKLAHLDDRGLEIATALREWLEHLAAGESGNEKERKTSAFDRMANETAFTYLNRLAALRMCEERGLVIECVQKGLTSAGFQLYERLAEQALGDRGTTYQVFLECMFDELAIDLSVLFDRRAVHSLIFPEPECIERVLELLNKNELKELWSNDETIGWVYQFFNSDEERKQMRKKSAAPRNSRELAVRNQFFTPRYVVEFLTDNTLGRTWYEMRQGDTRLTEQLDYFVRYDKEVFLSEGQLPQASAADQEDLSKEELLQQEVQIAFRAKKDPRDLKVLDPACGSGHFLLYAFDLLETIYEEAWSDKQLPASKVTKTKLEDDYKTEKALRQAVPKLVLQHNLYGVDIDQRACQIAALALWLRAQRRFKDLDLKPADPLRQITKTNIVCAEPMPGEKDLLDEFIAPMNPPILRQLTQSIFEAMKLAAEAGSLLKIEEEIRGPLAEARKKWEAQSERAKDKKGRDLLFSVGEMDQLEKHPQQLLDLSGITDDQFWDEAEPRILAELKKYAASATNGKSVQRSLFADDAEQGFAFVDLCRQRYDVVLMNPPFGDASLPSKPYIDDHYGDTKGDVYKAFVEAFEQRLVPNGLLGIISNRSGFFKKDSTDWREQVVLRLYRPMAIADLGYFVLDAKVETAAYTLRSLRPDEREQLTISLLAEVNALVSEVGSPFSVARYRDHRGLKRYQAEQELELLEGKGFAKFVTAHFPQYSHNRVAIAAAPPARSAQYPPLIAFRLLMENDKENTLLHCVNNKCDHRSYLAQPRRFDDLPNHSFAYWLPPAMRQQFVKKPPFESESRMVRVGLQTSDDPRFVRVWWEVPASAVCPPSQHPAKYEDSYCVAGDYRWFPFSKGGKYSPCYGELPCVLNWYRDGVELKAWAGSLYNNSHWTRIIKNVSFNFRPGLTYVSRNTVRTCAMALPAGSLFGHNGPGIFTSESDLLRALGRFCSYVADGFLSVSHGQGVERMSHRKQYEVGIMQRVPWADSETDCIETQVERAYVAIRSIRGSEESSRSFSGNSSTTDQLLETAVDALWQLDMVVAGEYGVSVYDLLLKGNAHEEKQQSAKEEIRQALKLAGGFPDRKTAAHNQLSFAVGCALGRWDVRVAQGTKPVGEPPAVFDPLPVCSPGMLTGDDDLPASATPDNYPIEIQWDGILVDDPGVGGNNLKSNDIVRQIREVWRAIHGDEAENTEQQICEVLKLDNLREYFRGSCAFFERHQKAYRKGGRDAPIYWPIATRSGAYTLWIYYPRLTDQTLYTAVNKYVSPKIDEINRRIVQIDEALNEKSGRDAVDLRVEYESCQSLLSELVTFRDELLRIAALPYKPDLNDGVMICAAPLWELIAHNAWSKKLKACWKSLSDAEYEWAHLAFSIWPDRVRAAAENDLSISIAHGLATGSELYDDEAVTDEAADELLDDDDDSDEEGDDDE